MCAPMPRLCLDIPLCTRSLEPPKPDPKTPPPPGFSVNMGDEFDMEVDHAPAVAVHRAGDDDGAEPTWDSVDDAMATLAEAQRAFSQQREFRHHSPGRGATLQVVPRAVAVTPAPARTATRVAPPAPNTWPQERPALGLKLDSEAVIRQMQQQQHNGGAGSPAGWTSPPQQPEAMPPSMRSMLPMDPLPSNGEALPHLVGDLFGAQAQAAICNEGLLNGHSYASSPSTVLQQTGAAPCPVEFNDTVQILCDEPQLAKGYLLNGNGKVQAVAVVNGGGNHGIVNGRLRDDDIDMSEV